MDKQEAIDKGLYNVIGEEIDKKYIAELKKAKKLCKKHSINKYDGYGHKKFYYNCTKCRSVWALTEPDGNFNGRLEKL